MGPSGRARQYYVRPGLWVADILEKNAIANLSSFVASAPDARSDVRTMTRQRDFLHPPADPVLRTERDMHQVLPHQPLLFSSMSACPEERSGSWSWRSAAPCLGHSAFLFMANLLLLACRSSDRQRRW